MKFYAVLIVLAVAYCVLSIMQINRVHDRRIASGEITFSAQYIDCLIAAVKGEK